MKLIKMVLRNFMAYPEAEIDFSDITKISGKMVLESRVLQQHTHGCF